MDDALTILGERAVTRSPTFNAEVHPDIVFRGLLMGVPLQTLAELVGISPRLLQEWVSEHPEMQTAVQDAKGADSQVMASIYYAAVGYDPHSETWRKPDMRAAQMWVTERLKWAKTAQPPVPADQASPTQLLALLRDMSDRVAASLAKPANGAAAAPPVVDVSRVNPDVDPGF